MDLKVRYGFHSLLLVVTNRSFGAFLIFRHTSSLGRETLEVYKELMTLNTAHEHGETLQAATAGSSRLISPLLVATS